MSAPRPAPTSITIAVDWENEAEAWWDAARASGARPAAFEDLLLIYDELTVSAEQADEIRAWAASLPGWDTGPAHARHPLIFRAAEVSS